MDKLVVKRTNASNQNFTQLVAELDRYLAAVDGKDHSFYDRYNQLDDIRYVIIAYINDKPVSCGAIKAYDTKSMEVKRMFTLPLYRGKGIASKVLQALEIWAKELSYSKCILETGNRQKEAVHLYQKNNYSVIPNYGQYADVKNSICFAKHYTLLNKKEFNSRKVITKQDFIPEKL